MELSTEKVNPQRDQQTPTQDHPLHDARIHLDQVRLLVKRERRAATAFRKRRALDQLIVVLEHVTRAVGRLAASERA